MKPGRNFKLCKRIRFKYKGFGLGAYLEIPKENLDVKRRFQPTIYNGMLNYNYNDRFGFSLTHKSLNPNNYSLG